MYQRIHWDDLKSPCQPHESNEATVFCPDLLKHQFRSSVFSVPFQQGHFQLAPVISIQLVTGNRRQNL